MPDGAVGAGSATLGPGLGGLWGFADPLAKRLLIRQLVILGLLRIAPLRRLVPESILEPPAVVVPAVSVVALVGSAVCSQRGRPALAKAVLHHLVTWGGIPVINESIGQMLEDVGDAGERTYAPLRSARAVADAPGCAQTTPRSSRWRSGCC